MIPTTRHYSNGKRLDDLRREIAEKGQPAQVEKVKAQEGKWYVNIPGVPSFGPYNSQTEAQASGYASKPRAVVEQWVNGDWKKSLKSFTGFLRAVKSKDAKTLEKVYGTGWSSSRGAVVQKTAMGEESGIVGGYLVPVEYSTRLLEVVSEESFIFPRANVIPMGSAETIAPMVNAVTAQTAGTSPFFGGVLFTWGSGDAPAETEPTFQGLSLKAWDLLGFSTVSNQWLNDVGEEGDERLLNILGRAAAWYSELAFLRGTGTALKMPLGVLSSGCLLSITRAGANSIVIADVAKMARKLIPYSWTKAIWACHPSALEKLAQIATFTLNRADAGEGIAGYIMGRPLFVTDKLPALGTAGDLILFDPSMYVIGARSEVVIDSSSENPNVFRTNQTDFRVWLRLDGKPQLSAPVTLADGTETASCCVALGAP